MVGRAGPIFLGGNGRRKRVVVTAMPLLLSLLACCKRERRKADTVGTGGCRRADEESVRQLEMG